MTSSGSTDPHTQTQTPCTFSDFQGESGPHLISQCLLPPSSTHNDFFTADADADADTDTDIETDTDKDTYTDDRRTETETETERVAWSSDTIQTQTTRPAPLSRNARAQTVPFVLPSYSFTDLTLVSPHRRSQVQRIRSSPFVLPHPTVVNINVNGTQMDAIEVELKNISFSFTSPSLVSIDPTLRLGLDHDHDHDLDLDNSPNTNSRDRNRNAQDQETSEPNEIETCPSSSPPNETTKSLIVDPDSIPKIATCCFREDDIDIESCITTSTTSNNASVCSSSSHGVRDEPETGPHLLSFDDGDDDDDDDEHAENSGTDYKCWNDTVICPSSSICDQRVFPDKKQRRYRRKIIGYIMLKLNNWCSK